MKTKIISTEGLLVIFILYGISVHNFPLSGQNADNLLLKNFRPVSIYKIPVTHVDKAAYPVIDVHSHDYAKTDEEIIQWLKNMDACGIEKSIVLTQTSGPKFDTIYNLYAKYGDRFEVWCGFDYTGYDKPGYGQA
ncbi:MAG: amidohydrolase, partial [Bacteroidia bacterium]|nr:amidohydrolase [Bacteroidia bacterium]